MIDIFQRLAPAYSRIMRKFSIDVWYNRADRGEFYMSAERYKRRYENELMAHYRKLGFPFRTDEIRHMGDEWLKDQLLLADKVRFAADQKKDRLSEEFDKLVEEKRSEVGALLAGVAKPEGRVVSVVSFSHNFEAKALQMGEQAAFELGRDINHAIVEGMGDVYRWVTQEDNRVRKTHRKLNNKIFSYNDPPTTIDEYGHTHTGNPGTDWGCRCYEVPASGRPLSKYVARA